MGAKLDSLETQILQATEKYRRATKAEEDAMKKIDTLEQELAGHKTDYQAKLDEFTRSSC